MTTYWNEFWTNAVVAAPAAVISASVQLNMNTPWPDAIVGGVVVFLLITLTMPLVRRWAQKRFHREPALRDPQTPTQPRHAA
jgi:hypothetical protein